MDRIVRDIVTLSDQGEQCLIGTGSGSSAKRTTKRSHRHVMLTPLGKEIAARAQRLLIDAEELQHAKIGTSRNDEVLAGLGASARLVKRSSAIKRFREI
jgi:hypothetical protein